MLFQKLVVDFVKQHYIEFIFYILILLFIFPLEDIIIPKIFGKLYETIRNTKSFGDPMNFYENMKSLNTPGLLSWIVIIYFVTLIAEQGKFYIESYTGPSYLKYLRSILFEGTVKKYQQEYSDVKTGEYISKVMELTRSVRDLFQYIISQFLPYILVGTVLIIYLCVMVPEIAFILVIFTFALVLMSIYASESIVTIVQKREDFFSKELAESIQDKLHNMMNIVTNNEGNNAITDNDMLEEKNKKMMEDIMRSESSSMIVLQSSTIISYGLCTFILYNMLREGKINVENMIAYLLTLGKYVTYMQNINWGILFSISYRVGIISSHKEFLEDILKHLDDKGNTDNIKSGDIHIKDLNFRYDNTKDEYIFNKLNMKIADREKVGIVGRSGSGKTTLMKMLVGLHTYESGEIMIGDTSVNDINKEQLRQHINYINQRTSMFNGNVLDNMKYGNKKSDDDIKRLLEKYDLHIVFSKLQDGIYNDVGVNGGQLSLGMQKVVMLVRGVCRKSTVIIFDEPLAALDSTTRSKIMKMILGECKNKTVIIITHDKEILPYMDRVININELQNE